MSGSLLPCRIVPAVTEVCRRQPAHSKVCAFLRSAHPFSWPHAGQTKPSGQRISISQAAQGVIVREHVLEGEEAVGDLFHVVAPVGRNV